MMFQEYEYLGEKMTIEELSKLSDIPKETICRRIVDGWSIEEAVETPVPIKRVYSGAKKYDYNGGQYTIAELVQISGLSEPTIRKRLERGKTVEEALSPQNIDGRYSTKQYLYKGQYLTSYELSKISGVPRDLITRRINEYGWSVERAVETVNREGRMEK